MLEVMAKPNKNSNKAFGLTREAHISCTAKEHWIRQQTPLEAARSYTEYNAMEFTRERGIFRLRLRQAFRAFSIPARVGAWAARIGLLRKLTYMRMILFRIVLPGALSVGLLLGISFARADDWPGLGRNKMDSAVSPGRNTHTQWDVCSIAVYKDPRCNIDGDSAVLAPPSNPHVTIWTEGGVLPMIEPDTGYWPQRRGPDRTNVSKETGLLNEWPEGGPPLTWKVEGIGEGIASVSIADGRIYTVGYMEDGEYAVALDQRSGERVWAARIGPVIPENRSKHWPSQQCPTVDEGCVYVITTNGELICLQAIDGLELWRRSYPSDFGAKRPSSGFCDYPLVDGDKLICAPGAAGAAMVALNKYTGEIIWKTEIADVDRAGHTAMITAELGGVRQHLAFFRKGLVGVAAKDGRFLWCYEKMGHRIDNSHTITVYNDQVLCSSGYGGGIALLKVVSEGSGFEVQEQYRQRMCLDPFHAGTVVVDGYVYTFRYRARPVCISLKTGEICWESKRTESGGSRVAAIYADGHIYIRRSNGVITLVEATPENYIEKGTFTIPDHEPSIGATSPVIAGGQLYLRDNGRLFSYDVREDGEYTCIDTAARLDLFKQFDHALVLNSRGSTKDG